MKFESKLVGEFFEMQKEIDRLFDSFTKSSSNVPTEAGLWQPPTDIYETADSFVVKMEVAGIKPDEDVKIEIEGNKLLIRGNRQDRTELKKQHYHQAGLNYGLFERTVVLPNVLEQEVTPTATYENGFLEIHILKEKHKTKEIVVVEFSDAKLTPDLERKELITDESE
ncbi:MAG: Hsp20/alpha crystallin family protein [Candidatus Poribacteria bacterium]|nr:hypothetical protein [Candidatus Poribacteria bacterium]MEC8894079.1 Hsp20/alpha crystallin family protein [Candidatus Poribacteria bacterium]